MIPFNSYGYHKVANKLLNLIVEFSNPVTQYNSLMAIEEISSNFWHLYTLADHWFLHSCTVCAFENFMTNVAHIIGLPTTD